MVTFVSFGVCHDVISRNVEDQERKLSEIQKSMSLIWGQ